MRRHPKIKTPDPSRFDRFDDNTLFLLIEHALGTAGVEFGLATKTNNESVLAHLQYCDTALSDAQAGIRSVLRRRIALAQNL